MRINQRVHAAKFRTVAAELVRSRSDLAAHGVYLVDIEDPVIRAVLVPRAPALTLLLPSHILMYLHRSRAARPSELYGLRQLLAQQVAGGQPGFTYMVNQASARAVGLYYVARPLTLAIAVPLHSAWQN